MGWIGKWLGGRVREDRHGRRVWVIERMVAGKSYSITLEVASEREALAELALFLRAPAAYRTQTRAAADSDAAAVRLTESGVTLFLDELKARHRSLFYRRDTRRYLVWWLRELGDRDLRQVQLVDLTRALDASANRKGRIIALKSFCSFLRGRGELRRQDDPTIDLLVPPPVPEKQRRQKGHTMEAARRVYRALDSQVARDVCRVRWTTGMHLSEVVSLVEHGEVRPLDGYGQIAGALAFWHKSSRQHMQSVDAATLAAAQRLKERAAVPWRNWLQEHLDLAAAAARVSPAPRMGEVRHSFVSWSKDHGEKVMPAKRGLPLEDIASAIGHASATTTRRFYDVTTVPPMVWVPELKLFHPDDPVQAVPRSGAREMGPSRS